MNEYQEAILLANRVLDVPNEDPDRDIAILARQFLRQIEKNRDMGKQYIEAEKSMFKVSSERYCVLNQETIEDLEKGERRVVPIRSMDFPTVRTEPPTLDEFNKNSIILKKD